jgi:hypothetical protein
VIDVFLREPEQPGGLVRFALASIPDFAVGVGLKMVYRPAKTPQFAGPRDCRTRNLHPLRHETQCNDEEVTGQCCLRNV